MYQNQIQTAARAVGSYGFYLGLDAFVDAFHFIALTPDIPDVETFFFERLQDGSSYADTRKLPSPSFDRSSLQCNVDISLIGPVGKFR